MRVGLGLFGQECVESVNARAPQVLVTVQEVAGFSKGFWVGGDKALSTVSALGDKACDFKHCDVLLDRGKGHVIRISELTNRRLGGEAAAHDVAARGVGEGLEDQVHLGV